MAASRISTNTHLTASKNDRRQAEARIRALQHRTNTLHEELTRTSANANSAVYDVEQTYLTLMQDLQDQRDQLIRRIQNAKQNIQHSTKELNGIRKHLRSTQSFHPTQNSSGHSADLETNNLNAMIDDTERVLTQIAQQLKQYRFKPTTNRSYPKSLGKIEIDKMNLRQDQPTRTMMYDYNPMENLSVHKLYVIDLDISPDWVAVSFDDRIFICDVEGETRIYSYSNHFHRQPILTERFHLSSIRLLSTFTVTHDYLIAFESDTQMLNLYKHHGALIVRIRFPYDPLMIIHSDYHGKNEIWSCSRTKRQCLHFKIHHTMKELHPIEQLDFKQPIVNILIDPVGISVDENDRIAVHDVNSTTSDRLLLFTNHFNKIIPLDLIKYADRQLTSRIDRVLLVPNQPNLIILIYSPQPTLPANEIVILDIEIQPTRILHRFSEPYGIRNIDITSNSELVYCVTPPANKRLASKMFVYSLIN